MSSGCHAPIAFATLVEYWLGDLPGEAQDRVEEHLFACGSCTAQLAELAGLAGGIRAAFREGDLHAVISAETLAMMRRAGLRLREYPVAPGGSVQCTIAAADDFVISRLAAPLQGIDRLDLVLGADGWPELRLDDIPFDAGSGEVLFCPAAAHLKTMPAHTATVRLLAHTAGRERTLGEYTFVHRPSDQ